MLDPNNNNNKNTPHPRAKERPQYNPPKILDGSKKTLCAPGPRYPTETEPDLTLSDSCRGKGQQWPATGTGALRAADLGHVACGISPLFWRRLPLAPP